MAPPKKVNGLRGDRQYVTSAARDDAGVNRPRSEACVADAPCLRRDYNGRRLGSGNNNGGVGKRTLTQ